MAQSCYLVGFSANEALRFCHDKKWQQVGAWTFINASGEQVQVISHIHQTEWIPIGTKVYVTMSFSSRRDWKEFHATLVCLDADIKVLK